MKFHKIDQESLKQLLDEKVLLYNQKSFIEDDPISIPHKFSKREDIEISGFIAAVLAWGKRKTIIDKANLFLEYMGNTPYEFIMNHTSGDLKPFLQFKHRTFNDIDALYFIYFLQKVYSKSGSLEEIFYEDISDNSETVEGGINRLRDFFVDDVNFPLRTGKHISSPNKKSACKRINMYLRWMVRSDEQGVDFGMWKKIKPSQLVCPCDLHVDKIARRLGLIQRKPLDWRTALELTERLKVLDPNDPVKYDFALFGMGVHEKNG